MLQYFPYATPRQAQADLLEVLEREWDNADVFVLNCPTAFGKTAIAATLMNAFHSVSYITPTNQLVEQFLQEFPDVRTLSRLDSYYCEEWDRSCSKTRGMCRSFCPGGVCPAAGDLAQAKYRKGPGAYNYHIFLAYGLHRDVLVVDEAHNLISFLEDRFSLIIWQHDYKYPSTAHTNEQIANWISTLPPNKKRHKKILALQEAVTSERPEYVAQRARLEFAGKGTQRGEPEMRDCIQLLPVDISDRSVVMWPIDGKKIVLLSATIGPKDVERLGLEGRKRIQYIDCPSPIPPGNRPIITESLVSVNRDNIVEASHTIARRIEELASFHPEKGVVHATYQMSSLLRNHLQGDRYLFHDRENKAEVYRAFRESDISDGRILVACGMYEGIDLPDDLGRWQVITKCPFASLGNPAVAYQLKNDPEFYSWQTVRTMIQACGRICRTPTDFGVTIILDASFRNLLERKGYMFPTWFTDALDAGRELCGE